MTRLRTRQSGFSLVELLVALLIFVIIIGVAVAFFIDFSRHNETESSTVEAQQAARVTADELTRNVQHLGYGIDRSNVSNPATWQKGLIYGDSRILAFNADLDPTTGELPDTATLTFPDGSTYKGESGGTSTDGAETYVYTLDANQDNDVTDADRTAAAPGLYNPAAETPNPLDFALFRQMLGATATAEVHKTVPLTAYLVTNATPSSVFPDGHWPDPLFSYWLTEDINGNNILDPTECVVAPCPPTTPRAPMLYLWGDSNFDGVFSDAEKAALRTLPVGSPAWAPNPLATGGVYRSTFLRAGVTVGSFGSTVIQVNDATGFGAGQFVEIGSGASAERVVLQGVNTTTTPPTLQLATEPKINHASSDPVKIIPDTLLRSVRSVEINVNSIGPRKVALLAGSGGAPAGMAGRQGSHGLEYPIRTYRRKVELTNLRTDALARSTTGGAAIDCPITIAPVCGGAPTTKITIFAPAAAPIPVSFVVQDSTGNPKSNVKVTFTNAKSAIGSLMTNLAVTDSSGIATVKYTASGNAGSDTVTATATCFSGATTLPVSATLQVDTASLQVIPAQACMSTISSRNPAPETAVAINAKNAAGTAMAGIAVDVSVNFDGATLPPTPDFTKLQAQLLSGGSVVATSDPTTGLITYKGTTNSSGTIPLSLRLTQDAAGAGTRIDIHAHAEGSGCPAGASADVTDDVTFYKTTIKSVNPAGCTTTTPCLIPADTQPPTVQATLTVNGAPLANQDVVFQNTDASSKAGRSQLLPSSGWTTDASGVASVNVATDSTTIITSSAVLTTTIDLVGAGASATCPTATFVPGDPPVQFMFAGQVGGCDLNMGQKDVYPTKTPTTDLSVAIQNLNLPGECPIRIKGVAFTVYTSKGALDNSYSVVHIDGGGTSTTSTATATNSVALFDTTCKGSNLANGAMWTFAATGTCVKPLEPPNPLPPQQWFVLNRVRFNKQISNLKTKVKFEVTVQYECAGACTGGAVATKKFTVKTP